MKKMNIKTFMITINTEKALSESIDQNVLELIRTGLSQPLSTLLYHKLNGKTVSAIKKSVK